MRIIFITAYNKQKSVFLPQQYAVALPRALIGILYINKNEMFSLECRAKRRLYQKLSQIVYT